MRDRCYNDQHISFRLYGGRGIKVCDRWLESVENFVVDMGQPPSAAHTLDRIDRNGNYEPSNCRWATRSEQQQNTCKTKLVTYNGETMCIAAWAERYGLPHGVLYNRILLRGWTTQRALTTAIRH